MKNLKIFASLAIALFASVPLRAVQMPFDEEHFPDEGVRTWLESVSGAVSNGMVETDKVTTLPNAAYARTIVDFSCAKYFTNLKGTLSFGYNTWTKLEKLDISGLTGVTALNNGLTGNSYSGTAYRMDTMKELVADGCTGLTSVIFPLCKNLEYASFQGCTALSTFWMYGKKLGTLDNYNYKLKALDISASDKLTMCGCRATRR